MREVNVPLLRKGVEWAEVEACRPFAERAWDQQVYRASVGAELYNPETQDYEIKCNTAYCIAGWTVAVTLGDNEQQSLTGDVLSLTGDFIATVEGRALEMLGLEGDSGLFDCNNSIEEVRRIAEEIAGERL